MTVMDDFIVDHYCLMFDRWLVLTVKNGYVVDYICLGFERNRGVVLTVRVGYVVGHVCSRFDREVVLTIRDSYIVDHICLGFNRGVVLCLKEVGIHCCGSNFMASCIVKYYCYLFLITKYTNLSLSVWNNICSYMSCV